MKIHCIEGLGGEIFGWLRTPMRNAGFDVKWYPWWITPKLPDGCILVGHSLGGGKAIRMVNEGLVIPKLLITIDPRLEPNNGFELHGKNFLGGMSAYNFYQAGFMCGYRVQNSINHETKKFRHTQMPQNTLISNLIRNYV